MPHADIPLRAGGTGAPSFPECESGTGATVLPLLLAGGTTVVADVVDELSLDFPVGLTVLVVVVVVVVVVPGGGAGVVSGTSSTTVSPKNLQTSGQVCVTVQS